MIPISRKRLLTTTLGVMLAVAIIFTSYTLGNNMARYQFYSQLKENPYQIEISVEGNFTSILNSYEEIENLEHVNNTVLWMFTDGFLEDGFHVPLSYVRGMNVSILQGSAPQEYGEVLAAPSTLESNNWSVGERITVHFYSADSEFQENYTISGVATWLIPGMGGAPMSDSQGLLLNEAEMENLVRKNVSFSSQIWVSIDAGYLLNSLDYNDAAKKIDAIRMQIYQILQENGIYYMESQPLFEDYTMPSYFFVIFSVFFSLPVIIMGVYLSRVGVEIEFLERRREFGILKIRGATGIALSKFVLIEAAIYTFFGGILGYVLGEFLAMLSNEIFFHMPYFFPDWGVSELVAALLTSSFLFFFALYSPWEKIKKEPIISLISHYSQSFKRVEYEKGRRDLALSTLLWGYLILAIWLTKNANFQGGFNILVILAFMVMATLVFMFPLILILLPLTMSRLLTMGTTKVYKLIASWIARAFKTSGELAERSIERSPKRAAYLAFILAFILTLSTFLAITMDNASHASQLQREMEVGGDLLVYTDGRDVPWELLNGTDVKSYVVVYSSTSSYPSIFEVNMRKYMDVIYDGEEFLKEGKLDGSGVVLTSSYAQSVNAEVGDFISVSVNNTTEIYRVEAIMYSFPGISEGDVIIDKSKPSGTPDRVILRVKNVDAVKSQLEEMGYDCRTPEKASDLEIMQLQFINTLLIYLVILGASAIFIVQYSALLNRRGEIALYKVRGARNKQIAAMLLTEGLTVIILSLIIGTAIGASLAYFMTSLMSLSTYLPEIFHLGSTFLIYTGVLLLSYILSQLFLSYMFARTKPSEVIRGLGGEM